MSDASFAAAVVAWQRVHGRRSLPWQQLGAARSRDPYRIWLAEVMLQQTTVAAVVPYYRRFVERFPDVATLAAASADDVMAAWAGLGYYSRARNLHAAAKRVVDAFGGRFPDTAAALATLPGVGRSTAGAIAAFAFGRREPILDANVRRVLARVFAIDGPPTGADFARRAWTIAGSLVPERDVERYTQGMMDLGATVCTPRGPACLVCPLASTCIAHREGREEAYPGRAPRKPLPVRRTVLVAFVHDGEILLERRRPLGIWGGLWSLPETDDDGVAVATARFGAPSAIVEAPGFVHGFTHFVLDARLVRVTVSGTSAVSRVAEAERWVAREALHAIGLPSPIRTLLDTLPIDRVAVPR